MKRADAPPETRLRRRTPGRDARAVARYERVLRAGTNVRIGTLQVEAFSRLTAPQLDLLVERLCSPPPPGDDRPGPGGAPPVDAMIWQVVATLASIR